MRCTGCTRIFVFLGTIAVLAVPTLAQNQAVVRLTNSDVVKMVNAGIPESVIVREIQMSEPNFNVTPDGLISLKRHHVPNGVLGAMVDSQAGEWLPRAVPPGTVYAAGPAFPQHFHRLPNVDATVRLGPKTAGKVQIRANQIKVEKAGVPLFRVTWKVNPSK
jgi:hypothetical protein